MRLRMELGILFFLLVPVVFAQTNTCADLLSKSEFPIALSTTLQKEENGISLDASCGTLGLYLQISNLNSSEHTVIYPDGYLFDRGGSEKLSYRGTNSFAEWKYDNATALLPFAKLHNDSAVFHLAFACAYDSSSGKWHCGCEDEACQTPKWSLQKLFDQNAIQKFPPATGRLNEIELPTGFGIHYFAENVVNARSLARGEKGTIFVGNRDGGSVYALVDSDGDFVTDEKYIIASGMDQPNGVEFVDGDLYVAEISRILKYENIEANLSNPPEPIVIYDDLPTNRSHGWKYLAKGPDNRLYFGIGAPCNVCRSEDQVYASLASIGLDGSDFEIFAEGIRNTVGFDWHPETGHLWFTENGRDRMGDDIPVDELNSAPVKGLHFGFPICHQGDILDPDFGENDQRSCAEFTPPKIKLGPHVAALGMKFYRGEMFPDEYQGDVFIAEHGSWNRSSKIGYQVSHVKIEDSEATSYESFATGWLQGEQAWGRPVDVLELPDGSLLVSDDFHNAVYRIYYQGL